MELSYHQALVGDGLPPLTSLMNALLYLAWLSTLLYREVNLMHLAINDLIMEVNLRNDRSTALWQCRISGCLTTPYSGLEPYGVKVPSTVLRGKGGSDPAGLPGTATADSSRLNSGWTQETTTTSGKPDVVAAGDLVVSMDATCTTLKNAISCKACNSCSRHSYFYFSIGNLGDICSF